MNFYFRRWNCGSQGLNGHMQHWTSTTYSVDTHTSLHPRIHARLHRTAVSCHGSSFRQGSMAERRSTSRTATW